MLLSAVLLLGQAGPAGYEYIREGSAAGVVRETRPGVIVKSDF